MASTRIKQSGRSKAAQPVFSPEEWAWSQICSGQIADFSARFGELDPAARKGWGPERTLTASFLRSILLDKQRAALLPVEGVRIVGARFTEALPLGHGRVERPVWLENCRFERPVKLTALDIGGRLSLRGSFFHGTSDEPALDLSGAAARHADLTATAVRGDLVAANAVFTGGLDLTGAAVSGALELGRVKAGCVFLRKASLRDVTLTSADIEQDVDATGATIDGAFAMGEIHIHRNLMMNGSKAEPAILKKELFLETGTIGGSVELVGVTIGGPVKMNGLIIERHLFMRRPDAEGETIFGDLVDLDHSQIRGHLQLSGASLNGNFTMMGAKISEDFGGWGQTRFHGYVSLSDAEVLGNVDLTDAIFYKGASANNTVVKGRLILDGVVADGVFDLTAARIEGNFTLSSTVFRDRLDLSDLYVGGTLFMTDYSGKLPSLNEVKITNAQIRGHFECRVACKGPFNAGGVSIGQNLTIMGTAQAQPVFEGGLNLGYARIEGIASITEARIESQLVLENVNIKRDFWLRGQLNCSVAMGSGDVGGSLSVSAAQGEIDMGGIHVGQDLTLIGTFPEKVKLSRARIGRALDASGAALEGLDLGEADIKGRLLLGSPSASVRWSNGNELDLRDATAGSLQDWAVRAGRGWDSSWPAMGMLQLDGFTYHRLGGAHVKSSEQMIERPAAWFEYWLALDQPYSPQPYEHLAMILRQAGESEKANRILFASREQARKAARKSGNIGRWIGLTLLMLIIGYGIGYRFFFALGWAILLTLVGAAVLGPGPVGGGEFVLTTYLEKAAYSFDQLLPIIELNRGFSEVSLPAPVENYFYAHKLLGFLLGSFIAAGVAGLTQRSKS
ncbi:MAG TPA: hypothetical protein VFZ91_04975 [Allosphingosinicella sp.]